MEKYLFTDGTNGVREVQSQEELKTLIESAQQPEKIRIWVFNSNEWISYAGFSKGMPFTNKENAPVPNKTKRTEDQLTPARVNGKRWLKKFLFICIAGMTVFLIYNFTKIRWVKTSPLNITAVRPANVPAMDVDSLVQFLEYSRGQKLDRITKTNLRIRNTWTDRIILQLSSDRDTSNAGSRYSNIELTIDNSTGYNIDNAIVKLTAWKNNEINSSDTFHFNNVGYAMAARRKIKNSYRGDSLSVSFQSIRAKVFNFCYSADKKSNYGNNNDRWFCRE
jgi:hypothetical protein